MAEVLLFSEHGSRFKYGIMFRRSLLSHQIAGVMRFKGQGGAIFLTEQVCAWDGPLSFLAGSAKQGTLPIRYREGRDLLLASA